MRNTSDPGRRALRLVIWLSAAAAAATLAFAACKGGGGFPLARPPMAELESLPCPEGVDSALWAELKEALEEALETELAESRPGSPARLLEANHGRDARATKITAAAPTGDANQVDDLSIVDNGDGTYTLTWHYRNLGDYDQNGVVALEDIIPLAEHFGQSVPESDTERNSIQAVIDGSGNGKVGIEEVTPIAQNFLREVQRYVIEGADSSEGPWAVVGEVAQDAGTGEGRLEYSAIIQSPAALWHRVVPYDTEGTPGEPSNAALRPSNEPIIYGVTPTEGYQHEECTFTATVTGAEPLTFAWDFGSGANPDASSDVSPTVTLAEAGEYSAVLTVTNAYGEASFPFTLAVTERDMWAHTWGGEAIDSARTMTTTADGSVLTAGATLSFGAGRSDVLLQKLSQNGSLMWCKAFGSDTSESAYGVDQGPDGTIYVSGVRAFAPSTYTDCFVMALDENGDPLWTMVYTSDDYEAVDDMLVGVDGNIYACGYSLAYGGEKDVLLLKAAPDGALIWARTWGGVGADAGLALGTDVDGDVYVSGYTDSFGASTKDVLLLKFSSLGSLIWGRTWGGDDEDYASGITLDGAGNVFVAGITRSFGAGIRDAVLLKFGPEGNILQALTWVTDGSCAFSAPVWDETKSSLCVAGTSWGLLGTGTGILAMFDSDLEQQLAAVWVGAGSVTFEGLALDSDGNTCICGVAESSEGGWQAVSTIVTCPEGEVEETEGAVSEITLAEEEVEWLVSTPEGTIDMGGGDNDVLILKNFAR